MTNLKTLTVFFWVKSKTIRSSEMTATTTLKEETQALSQQAFLLQQEASERRDRQKLKSTDIIRRSVQRQGCSFKET